MGGMWPADSTRLRLKGTALSAWKLGKSGTKEDQVVSPHGWENGGSQSNLSRLLGENAQTIVWGSPLILMRCTYPVVTQPRGGRRRKLLSSSTLVGSNCGWNGKPSLPWQVPATKDHGMGHVSDHGMGPWQGPRAGPKRRCPQTCLFHEDRMEHKPPTTNKQLQQETGRLSQGRGLSGGEENPEWIEITFWKDQIFIPKISS